MERSATQHDLRCDHSMNIDKHFTIRYDTIRCDTIRHDTRV